MNRNIKSILNYGEANHLSMKETSKTDYSFLEHPYSVAFTFILEMNYEFHRLGLQLPHQANMPDEMESIINGVNVHLRGVALRLKAQGKFLAS